MLCSWKFFPFSALTCLHDKYSCYPYKPFMSTSRPNLASDHRQHLTTASITSTVIDSSFSHGRLSPNDTKIEGLPPSATSATFFQQSSPKEETTGGLVPPVIPPTHSHRTLVVCFDGTGDQFDCDNSNIVQLVSLLKKDDRSKQLVYYQVSRCYLLYPWTWR